MKRLLRFLLALALTASPALAAPPCPCGSACGKGPCAPGCNCPHSRTAFRLHGLYRTGCILFGSIQTRDDGVTQELLRQVVAQQGQLLQQYQQGQLMQAQQAAALQAAANQPKLSPPQTDPQMLALLQKISDQEERVIGLLQQPRPELAEIKSSLATLSDQQKEFQKALQELIKHCGEAKPAPAVVVVPPASGGSNPPAGGGVTAIPGPGGNVTSIPGPGGSVTLVPPAGGSLTAIPGPGGSLQILPGGVKPPDGAKTLPGAGGSTSTVPGAGQPMTPLPGAGENLPIPGPGGTVYKTIYPQPRR